MSATRDEHPRCILCGEPMPPGEEMFKYHGYSGDCPKPPLARPDEEALQNVAVDLPERLDALERVAEDHEERDTLSVLWRGVRLASNEAASEIRSLRALLEEWGEPVAWVPPHRLEMLAEYRRGCRHC